MRDEEVGGGIVRRAFTSGGKTIPTGSALTREQILAIPLSNRRVLVDMGSIAIYPPSAKPAKSKSAQAGERFVIACANGRYDVIEGQRLNPKPLTLKQAEKLAVGPEAGAAKH